MKEDVAGTREARCWYKLSDGKYVRKRLLLRNLRDRRLNERILLRLIFRNEV
jgi:hypothetical protein